MLCNIHLDEGQLASILCPQNSPELRPLYKFSVQFFCVHDYLNPSQIAYFGTLDLRIEHLCA
jgi:hypothetical protein